jgi:copper chaperone
VKSYEVSLDSQTATVVADASLPYDTVLATIKKTGKTVNSGEADGSPMGV